jgi:hypothetical protein
VNVQDPAQAAAVRAAWNLVLESELRRIVGALENRGINVIVLKGLPLMDRIGESIDGRALADNDMLVRRVDAPRACRVLFDLGYESVDCRTIERQLDLDFQYRLTRRMTGGGSVAAELHWNAFPPTLYPVPEAILWSRTEQHDLGGMTVTVFDKPLTLLHLAGHFEQHAFSDLRILGTFARAWSLWKEEIDVPALVRLARETGLACVLEYALLSARDLGLLTEPMPEIGSRRVALLRRLLPARRLGEPPPQVSYGRRLLALLLADPRGILGWLRVLLFPPLETMAVILRRPLSRWLYIRYLTRPLRPVGRILGVIRDEANS